MGKDSTEQLVRRFQSSGDVRERNEIFAMLYKRYIKLALHAANKFKNGLSKEEIEDAGQETMIELAGTLDSFKWQAEKAFTTWIYYIAYNKASYKFRKQKKPHEQIEKVDQINNPDNLESVDALTKLFKIWKDFDPQGYEQSYLHDVENWTDKKIAKKLGILEDSARKRRKRAVEKFKKHLSQKYGVKSINEWIEYYTLNEGNN